MNHKIPYEKRRVVYQAAIEKYGEENQLNKFDEELGEFLTEYGRMRNGEGNRKKLADECADLTIMLEQLRMIFGINVMVCQRMDYKVGRLMQRVKKPRKKSRPARMAVVQGDTICGEAAATEGE